MSRTEVVYSDAGNRFEKYTGQAVHVQLLSHVGTPLTVIGAKAFLSCKSIEKLVLPDSLESVEDWGFAHMKNLREITLPAKDILFGKKVFLGCDRLQKVKVSHFYEGFPHFLASMFRFFPEKRLENLKMIGDEQRQWEWLTYYDEALLAYMLRQDDYDFVPAFIGWFDVEDVDDQKEHYVLQQRKHKIRLAMQRLLYAERLSERGRQYLDDYIMKESPLVEQLFLDSEEDCSRDIRLYRVWEGTGALDRECAARLLEHIPESEPEIRGYLLKMQLENVDSVNFFAGLDL